MNARSLITLAGIAVVVTALGFYRSRDDDSPPRGDGSPTTSSARPAILDFGRGECQACKQMMPVLDEVRDAHAGIVDVRYFDLAVPGNLDRAHDFGVKLIPTQVFVAADGTEMFRHEGFLPRQDIERKLIELGWTSSR